MIHPINVLRFKEKEKYKKLKSNAIITYSRDQIKNTWDHVVDMYLLIHHRSSINLLHHVVNYLHKYTQAIHIFISRYVRINFDSALIMLKCDEKNNINIHRVNLSICIFTITRFEWINRPLLNHNSYPSRSLNTSRGIVGVPFVKLPRYVARVYIYIYTIYLANIGHGYIMNLSRVLGKHPTGVTRLPEGFNTADEHANVLPRNIRFPLSAIFMDFVRQKEKKKGGGGERRKRENISFDTVSKRFSFISSPWKFHRATATLAHNIYGKLTSETI